MNGNADNDAADDAADVDAIADDIIACCRSKYVTARARFVFAATEKARQ